MNIIYVGQLPPHPGGGAVRDGQLVSGLAERRHNVAALALVFSDRPTFETITLSPNVRIVQLTLPGFGDPFPLLTESANLECKKEQVQRSLPALIDEQRPDVLLAHGQLLIGGLPEFCRRRMVPCVILQHDLAFLGYPADLGDSMVAALRAADLTIVCAEHIASIVTNTGVDRVVAIPNGINTDRFRPTQTHPRLRQELGIPSDAPIVLHVSNLKSAKRPLDLIQSALLSVEDCPQLHYLVAGDGPDRATIELMTRDYGLGGRFQFAGWVGRERMPEHLALADIVILPSESEGMSLACLEAMACGRLVIASDIRGMREVIKDGETGLLFRMGDVRDLTAKTLLAAHDPELRATIGGAARVHVEKHHRLDDMVTRYEAVLRDLVLR